MRILFLLPLTAIFITAAVVAAFVAAFTHPAIPASAQTATGAASLDVACTGTPIPSGIDTVTRCTFTARNIGSTPLDKLKLTLAATQNLAIPDRYYFFAATRDGQPLAIAPGDLEYAFNDLAPGVQSVIVLTIIIRSTRTYGADAILVRRSETWNVPDQIFDTELIQGEVSAATTPTLAITLDSVPPGGVGGEAPPREGLLTVENSTTGPIDGVELSLAFGTPAEVIVTSPELPDLQLQRSPDRAIIPVGRLVPGQLRRFSISFASSSDAQCQFASPAVTVTSNGNLIAAKISDTSIALGTCDYSGQQGGGGPESLPQGGSGPGGQSSRARYVEVVSLLVAGLAFAALGVRLRMRQRSLR